MRVLGIDPGYAIVGYGVLDYNSSKFKVLDFGAVKTKAGESFPCRLQHIFESLIKVIDLWQPEVMAIEKVFHNTNAKTVMDVSQARGVIILAAQVKGLDIVEYTPLQVKQSVVGYGRADKKQVQEMTRIILKLNEVPKPDDTADALALAICHAHSSSASQLIQRASRMSL
ncbi:MAG TPA: crossover junction endodeoxyribonuclease RuvC [Clostridiales bacterium]|nr:crossover junction endodeoxyribonuclease RuvC [Clostridiales bacterium]HQD73330.1 crossover junction endodeoxyribonuclease RuvC [Clostridiales bacterium]